MYWTKRTDFTSNLKYCVVFEDFYTRDIKHYRMREISDFIYFLKKEVQADIFLITQNKSDVPEPILELSNNVITFEPKEQKKCENEQSSDTESEEQQKECETESENQQSSDIESEETKECENNVESVPKIIHNFLFNSVDRLANYISNSKYINKMNEKHEYCVICLNCKECTSTFLSLPFCKNCEMHLYNNDIDISKSMKEHCICWKNDKRPIYDKTQYTNTSKKVLFCVNTK